MSRITEMSEATGLSNNDYVLIDSPTKGTRKYLASNFSQGGGGGGEDMPYPLTEIEKDTSTSGNQQTYTKSLTPGIYCVFFTVDRADDNTITYSGTSGTDYNLIHNYRASTHAYYERFPLVAVDVVEIINDTTVTLKYTANAHSGYGIYLLNNVSTVGDDILTAFHQPNSQPYTDDLSQVTSATDYVLLLVVGSDQFVQCNYYLTMDSGEPLISYYPTFSNIGEPKYTCGSILVVGKDLVNTIVSSIQNTGAIGVFVCELS